ncbi:hypothetical protein [Bacillus sp. B15-48]|uniref:YphA family membrane protein n=1 Tax=Bacillus sp. B15-48 TaxID=1548601 RepID=UPI00193EFFD1|nr:hypothetical protein [Bacillus sp. B15-48]MBM4762138.1 hypothetical protein [Bacillus sp. B15-48]
MEGIIFYWFAWIGWIWFTFIMNKTNNARFSLSIWVLVLIISSPYKVVILEIEVYMNAFILWLFFIFSTFRLSNRVFFSVFFSSFITMLGYVSFLLFELFDPVWVVFDRKWMIAISGILLSSILQSNLYLRSITLVSGMLLGEFLFSVLLNRLGSSYPVASPAFMDILAITAMTMAVWLGINYFAQVTGSYIYQGKEKQKSS